MKIVILKISFENFLFRISRALFSLTVSILQNALLYKAKKRVFPNSKYSDL